MKGAPKQSASSKPSDLVFPRYKAGAHVLGKVTKVTDVGAFVELEKGVEGLIRDSEIHWLKKLSRAPRTGDRVDVVILSVDRGMRRIALACADRQKNVHTSSGARAGGLATQLASAWNASLELPQQGTDATARVFNDQLKLPCPQCHAAIPVNGLKKHIRNVHSAYAEERKAKRFAKRRKKAGARKRQQLASNVTPPLAQSTFSSPSPASKRTAGSAEENSLNPNLDWLFQDSRATSAKRARPKNRGDRQQAGRSTSAQDLANIRIVKLSFRLLPHGKWDIATAVEHYRLEAGRWLGARQFQVDRLHDLQKLQPTKCYVGSDMWRGYLLFEFPWSQSVVLECPIEGNATYVLAGDWNRMVKVTKGHLQAQFSKSVTKVVHKGDWLVRIYEALHMAVIPALAGRVATERKML